MLFHFLISNKYVFFRNVSGINMVLDMTSSLKGVSPGPVDFGLAFDKDGYQLGVTGTAGIPSFAVSNTKFRLGFAGCGHFNVNHLFFVDSNFHLLFSYLRSRQRAPTGCWTEN